MAETKHYAFVSPELHWLNYPVGLSLAFKRNALLMQNLLSVSANQDSGNHNLVAHGKASKSSPNGKDRNIEKELLEIITRATVSIDATTAVAPMQRVYILMQCQNEMIKAGRLSTPYKGMKDCLHRTIKHVGVRSLWRGNSVNVIKLCAGEAIILAFRHLPYKNYMDTKVKESPLWILPFFATPLMLCHYPLDYARVRLATDVKAKFSLDFSRNDFGKRQFNGAIDVYKKTLRLDGIHGLYPGFSVSYIGLFAYDLPKRLNPTSSNEIHNQKKPTMLDSMVMGMVMWSLPVVFYPVNTASQRTMMTSGEASKYRGAMDVFYQIVKTEGVSIRFKIEMKCNCIIMSGKMYNIYSWRW